MTIDDELVKLDENIRRLKIEYEAYFNGGQPRPPHDTAFRVENAIKKFSDGSTLSFGQRFRFDQLVQRYNVHKELWRKRLKDKEEGRSRPGVLTREEDEAKVSGPVAGPVGVVCADPEKEKDKIELLFKAAVEARRKEGARVDNIDPAAFLRFICEKTRQMQQSAGCDKVQISVEGGKVKFKAVKSD